MELDLSEGTSSDEEKKLNNAAVSQSFNFNNLLQHPHGGNKILYELLQ